MVHVDDFKESPQTQKNPCESEDVLSSHIFLTIQWLTSAARYADAIPMQYWTAAAGRNKEEKEKRERKGDKREKQLKLWGTLLCY